MKKLIAISLLAFVFTAFTSVSLYSQTQEAVETEQVKKHCPGHPQDGSQATGDVKSVTTPKAGCAGANKKCPSTCPHAKAAQETNDATSVKTEQVKTNCPGHNQDGSQATGDVKSVTTPKAGCAGANKKCPSTCPKAKAAQETKDATSVKTESVKSEQKKTPVPQM